MSVPIRCEVCGRVTAQKRAKGCVPGDCILQRVDLQRAGKLGDALELGSAFVALLIVIGGLALIPAVVLGGIAFALRAGWALAVWMFR